MRFWILVGCGVLVLAAAIWPFGKKAEEPTSAPVAAHIPAPAPTPPKPEPAKVIEVLDLSRAYEPAREPEPISPATYLELLPEPERIDVMPRAVEPNPFRDVIERVQEAPTGSFLPGVSPSQERVHIMPQVSGGVLQFVPPLDNSTPPYYSDGFILQTIPPTASWPIQLAVMPRLLPARFVIEQPDGRLLHYLETENDAVVRVPHGHSPAADHLTHPIPRKAFTVPLIPVEYLTVAPRPHVVIHREEQERQTGVREDDFAGQIGP